MALARKFTVKVRDAKFVNDDSMSDFTRDKEYSVLAISDSPEFTWFLLGNDNSEIRWVDMCAVKLYAIDD